MRLALQSITEGVDIEGYYEMVKSYMDKSNIKFAKEHSYTTYIENDQLHINIPE